MPVRSPFIARSPTLVALVLALVLPPGALAAQSADVRAGDRVRLDAPALGVFRLTGLVARTSGDTLLVEVDDSGRILPVATDLVSKLAVSLGRTPRGDLVRQGVVAGGAAGAVVGATIGLTGDEDCRIIAGQRKCEADAGTAVGAAAVGAVLGAVLGGAIGLLRPAERWVDVDPPIRLAIAPSREGSWSVAMRLRVSF